MHNYAGCIWRENCPDRSIKPLKKSIYCVVSQCSGSISISGSGLLSENFPHLFQGTKVKLKKNLASFALTILGGFGSFQNSLIRGNLDPLRWVSNFMHIAYALKSQLIKLNQIYVLTLQLPYVSLSLFFFFDFVSVSVPVNFSFSHSVSFLSLLSQYLSVWSSFSLVYVFSFFQFLELCFAWMLLKAKFATIRNLQTISQTKKYLKTTFSFASCISFFAYNFFKKCNQCHKTFLKFLGEHVRSNLCYLIYLRHLIKPKRPFFLHACATCSELPSDISNM